MKHPSRGRLFRLRMVSLSHPHLPLANRRLNTNNPRVRRLDLPRRELVALPFSPSGQLRRIEIIIKETIRHHHREPAH